MVGKRSEGLRGKIENDKDKSKSKKDPGVT